MGHELSVNGAQFSPDGQSVVTDSGDKTARVWGAASGKLLATLQGHEFSINSVQFSPDGQHVVTASSDETARSWEVGSGKLLAILRGHEKDVMSAQFSPDGKHVVTASYDNTARVWEAASGKVLATLQGHEDEIWSAQFSSDGQRIITASKDETAMQWAILPASAGPPPEWLRDLLHYLAQRHLNTNGEMEWIKTDGRLALRERLRVVLHESEGKDDPYFTVLRLFVKPLDSGE